MVQNEKTLIINGVQSSQEPIYGGGVDATVTKTEVYPSTGETHLRTMNVRTDGVAELGSYLQGNQCTGEVRFGGRVNRLLVSPKEATAHLKNEAAGVDIRISSDDVGNVKVSHQGDVVWNQGEEYRGRDEISNMTLFGTMQGQVGHAFQPTEQTGESVVADRQGPAIDMTSIVEQFYPDTGTEAQIRTVFHAQPGMVGRQVTQTGSNHQRLIGNDGYVSSEGTAVIVMGDRNNSSEQPEATYEFQLGVTINQEGIESGYNFATPYLSNQMQFKDNRSNFRNVGSPTRITN